VRVDLRDSENPPEEKIKRSFLMMGSSSRSWYEYGTSEKETTLIFLIQ
jgi:hypothetical protein